MANIFTKLNGSFERKIPSLISVPGIGFSSQGIYTGNITPRTIPPVSGIGPVADLNQYARSLDRQQPSGIGPVANLNQYARSLNSVSIPTQQPIQQPVQQPTQQFTKQPVQQIIQQQTQQPIGSQQNPYDAFNLLLQESLKAAQKIDTSDMLKQQRILQREAIARTQGTGRVAPTAEELKFLSPQQQASMRSADIGALSPDLDEVAYQITRAEQDRKNLIEQINFARESGDKMRERQLDEQKMAFDREKFDEEKRQFGLEYALKSREVGAKYDELAKTTDTKTQEALATMNLVNSLISNPGTKKISGYIQGFLGLGNVSLSGNAQLARNQYNQIKGQLALENRGKLKGQGAVSDFEGKTLERAASSLARNLNDDEFINQLTQIKGAIATSHGLSTNVKITDPTTNQSTMMLADSQGIAEAIKDGLLVEYK